MKNIIFFLLVISFVLGSCTKDEQYEDIVQPVLFEYEYLNHAWVYSHMGWMIDENGMVRGFNLPEKWTFPDADGFISKNDLKENLTYTDTSYQLVNNDELLKHFASRYELLNGRIDTADTMMADAGMSVLYLYVWNSNKEMYQKKLLKSQGDLQLTNNNIRTKGIVDWLIKVGQDTDRFYWGF